MAKKPADIIKAISTFFKKSYLRVIKGLKDLFASLSSGKGSDKEKKKSVPKRKKFRLRKPRVYILRGYTTTSRVDKKVRAEQTHRLIRNFLVVSVFVLIIAILLLIFNPLKDIKELFRMIGI